MVLLCDLCRKLNLDLFITLRLPGGGRHEGGEEEEGKEGERAGVERKGKKRRMRKERKKLPTNSLGLGHKLPSGLDVKQSPNVQTHV